MENLWGKDNKNGEPSKTPFPNANEGSAQRVFPLSWFSTGSSAEQLLLANGTALEFLRTISPKNLTKTGMLSDDDPDPYYDDPQYQICSSETNVNFPQEALNFRGQRRFIINFQPFMQAVTTEICRPKSLQQPCNYVGVPPGYQAVCMQKEVEHRLTTIDTDFASGVVQTGVDLFRFPSSCSCKLVRSDTVLPPTPCGPQSSIVGPPYGLYGDDAKARNASQRSSVNNPPPVLSARTETLFADVPSSGAKSLKWKGFLL